MKKLIGSFMAMMVGATILTGCGNDGTAAPGDNDGSSNTHAFVFKSTGNPFGERMQDGFEAVIEENGGTAILRSPEQPTAEGQIQIIEQLITQGVDSITIAGNDYDALQPVLQRAMDQGIQVLSVDSAVNADSRMIHVNQANGARIGQVLIEGVAEMIDGEGQIAILSATSQAANQNLWIEYMKQELERSEFSDIELVRVAFGDDLRDKSVTETQALLRTFPDLRAIVAPTTVGLAAASLVITDNDLIGDVVVTGLGLPSEMAAFIENGTTPWMYLWNPIEVGNAAAYTAMALTNGDITGAIGETYNAGVFGTLEIVEDGDGTQVMLGDPFRFDPSNIAEWKEVY